MIGPVDPGTGLIQAKPPKKLGRPPARYVIRAIDDTGKLMTRSTSDPNESANWLMWHYAQGHDVEVEDRLADITLRAV